MSRRFRCLAASSPAPELCADPDAYWPDWKTLPSRVGLVTVPWQPVGADLPRVVRRGKTIRYVEAAVTRCFIRIQGTFDDYLNRFSSKSRKKLKRSLRKFWDTSSGGLREFASADNMATFLDIALRVSRRSWQGKQNVGLPSDEGFRARVLERAALGTARGYILFAGEQPVAYMYCPIEGSTLLYETVGFDPQYTNLAPGTVLFLLVLQRLFAERRFAYFDLGVLEGDPYKSRYSTDELTCANVYFFPRTLRNEGLVLTHSAVRNLVRWVTAASDAFGVGAGVRRLSRQMGLSPTIACEPDSPDGRPRPIEQGLS